VHRWLQGRTPHPRHRARVAQALDADELDLWPDAQPVAATENPLREIAGAYPHGNDPDTPDLRELLDTATERIELLDHTLEVIITEPGIVDQLANKAANGATVRILISDPDSHWIHDQELDGEPDTGDNHDEPPIQMARAREHLEPLVGKRGIEIRSYIAQRFNTILRFDEHMLLSLHLYNEPTSTAPLLHLQREQDAGMFDRFAEHYQRIWQHASVPVEPEPDSQLAPEPDPDRDRAPTAEEAQQALNRLRARRPL
jgi:hypothetical protein